MNFMKAAYRCTILNDTLKAAQNQMRYLQVSKALLSTKRAGKASNAELIRLYDSSGQVIGTKTKQEAENIAKKNGFTLVPMEILGKPKFPEFQLKSRYEESVIFGDEKDEDLNDKQAPEKTSTEPRKPKEIKRITFETSIASADLKVKMDSINNWITKDKQVHLIVQGQTGISMDTFFKKISEKLVEEVRVLHKKQKGNNLKIIMDKNPKFVSTHSPDDSSEKDRKYSSEDFEIDPELLKNDVELEKVLSKNKKVK